MRWAAARRAIAGSLILRRLWRIAPQLVLTLFVAALVTRELVVLRAPLCKDSGIDPNQLVSATGGKKSTILEKLGPNDLLVASSQEKAPMLAELAKRYNDRGGYLEEGLHDKRACVYVNLVRSGDAESFLETGWRTTTEPRPDVWAPAKIG